MTKHSSGAHKAAPPADEESGPRLSDPGDAEASGAAPPKPRMTAAQREALRREAAARYEAGEYLTFEEFVATPCGRLS